MSVQLIWLRPETPGGEIQRGKQRHMFTKPVIFAPSVKDLFEKIQDYVAKIPAEERWNTFYTVANCTKKIRDMVEQDVLAFDIDGVDLTKLLDYAPVVAKRLGIPEDQMSITHSGNGLHFIVQLEKPLQKSEIAGLQTHYKELVKLLDQDVGNAGLAGHFDMILDVSRILRLPFTENRKQKGVTHSKLLQCDFTPHALSLKKLSGLPEVEPHDALSEKEFRKRFSKPDTKTILSGCEFLKWTKESGSEVKEPQGYAALSVLARLDDDGKTAREFIAGWTGSGSIAQWDADAKIEQARAASGPRTCKNISLQSDKCATCAYNGKIVSPIAIRGPDYIATIGQGFHDILIGKDGERFIPNPHDLRKFYEQEAPYRVINKKLLYRWDGKVYREIHPLALRCFGEEHFMPKPRSGTLDEFEDVVARYHTVDPNWFAESTEGFVNFENIVLHWKTGAQFQHDPTRGFRNVLPFHHVPGATAPVWEKFLLDIFDGDADKARLIEEFMGYALSGDAMWMQKALILVGQGSNGKSTLIEVLQALAGKDNFSSVKADKFNEPTFVQMLDGKLFNISGETPRKGFEESAGVKELTGGDTITGRKLYGQPFYFNNRAKIIFSCNEIPRTVDNTHGFYRRFWVVEFKRTFDPSKGVGDFKIGEKLRAELPGIFNRVRAAYQGAKDLEKFTEPKAVTEALEDLRQEMDVVGEWIRDNLKGEPGAPVRVYHQEVWDRFAADMNASGNGRTRDYYSSQKLAGRIARAFPTARKFRTNAGRGFEFVSFHNRDDIRQ